MTNKLFSYEDVGASAKYCDEIYIGCLIVTGIICLISLIIALRADGFFKKVFGIIVTVGIGFGLWWLSGFIQNRVTDIGEAYDRYNDAYENEEVIKISGTVTDFTPGTDYKTFTVDGVTFTVYPAGSENATPTDGNAILYYTYKPDKENVSFVKNWSGNLTSVKSYTPEKCVIIGNGQKLEIHYIIENDEKHILFIGEFPPETE